MTLFENPIKSVKVRKNVTAKVYINGCININGVKYFGYSLTQAVRLYRRQYPIK